MEKNSQSGKSCAQNGKKVLKPPPPKNMESQHVENYWNHYGDSEDRYDNEIASSIDEDISLIIKTRLTMEAKKMIELHSKNGNVINICDYGCGPGKWLQKINNAFKYYDNKKIYGMDVSQNLVNLAKNILPSAHVERANLEVLSEVQNVIERSKIDFGVCANVLIAAETNARRKILSNISSTTRKGAIIIFVVPSLESALYCERRWLKDGEPVTDTGGDEIPHSTGEDAINILNGTLERDSVRTKHYLEAEFNYLLSKYCFKTQFYGKASYKWTMEFGEDVEDIPKHLTEEDAQGPWDWLFVAEKMSDPPEDSGK